MGLDIFFSKVRKENVGYFRKVNFLVKFFQEKGFNVDTQEDFYINKDHVKDLIDRCQRVLEDHTLAEDLLPTMEGFFFGSTDYDEYYFDNVKEVLNYCQEELLPLFDNLSEDEFIAFCTWY